MLQTEGHTRTDVLLDVADLRTYFFLRHGILKAVDGVSFQLKPHETLAIVGESGCGKVDDRAVADAADPRPARQDRQRLSDARRT
jgi:ABC-type dipeptide/oligopeptide/nickel transport system ATPase component